jgi:hypothetical protein
MSAAVVADGWANRFGQRCLTSFNRLLNGQGRCSAFICATALFRVIHIRLVMFAVVDLHRARVNVRLERIKRVGQGAAR